MKRLDDLIDKLSSFESLVLSTVEKTIRANSDIIIDMNVEDQLFEKGVNRVGVRISDYAPYSPVTIAEKNKKGQVTGRVTLRDSEDYHLSHYIEFRKDEFEIKASDWKTEGLVRKYGKEIMGLTQENFNDLAVNYVAPEVLKAFKEIWK